MGTCGRVSGLWHRWGHVVGVGHVARCGACDRVWACGRVWGHVVGDGGMSQGLGAYGRWRAAKKSKMLTMNEVHKNFNLTQ